VKGGRLNLLVLDADGEAAGRLVGGACGRYEVRSPVSGTYLVRWSETAYVGWVGPASLCPLRRSGKGNNERREVGHGDCVSASQGPSVPAQFGQVHVTLRELADLSLQPLVSH